MVDVTREVMNYDVLIVGGGPSGLATGIHLKQLNSDLSIAILEKGASIGANILSGCVMDPQALNELIPDWDKLDFPVTTQVSNEEMLFLTQNAKIKLPIPKDWVNNGNYIISLGHLCQRLASYAEDLGVEIYPGFAAVSPIIEQNKVVGIITGDMGVARDGTPTSNYQAGIEIRAKQVVIAEGCRGSLAKQIIKHFNLDKDVSVQTYGLGIKEIWQIDSAKHQLGKVEHYVGYPLGNNAYGGGFLYHQSDGLLSIGLVTSLDYTNPYLNPYAEFQKFKLHPTIRSVLEGGKVIEYGARTVVEGGIQALPKLTFPGGLIVGDSAGFLNVAKIKGVHNAIKSGMLAASAIAESFAITDEAIIYTEKFHQSWLYKDLYKVRNFRPSFRLGLYFGLIYAAIDYYVFSGMAPWTFKLKVKDNERLREKSKQIVYPCSDGVISFERSSSLHLANISHDENQPCHLLLNNEEVPIKINLAKFVAPETRYCPAGVYEIINGDKLQIHAQNCVHCKACDIKDPVQNITWIPPSGGSGPQYSEM
jgi:electron-transferring-flavoprotein dehydrogenase